MPAVSLITLVGVRCVYVKYRSHLVAGGFVKIVIVLVLPFIAYRCCEHSRCDWVHTVVIVYVVAQLV